MGPGRYFIFRLYHFLPISFPLNQVWDSHTLFFSDQGNHFQDQIGMAVDFSIINHSPSFII